MYFLVAETNLSFRKEGFIEEENLNNYYSSPVKFVQSQIIVKLKLSLSLALTIFEAGKWRKFFLLKKKVNSVLNISIPNKVPATRNL